jgi:ADP-Ribosyltransferase in polyvalent proteins
MGRGAMMADAPLVQGLMGPQPDQSFEHPLIQQLRSWFHSPWGQATLPPNVPVSPLAVENLPPDQMQAYVQGRLLQYRPAQGTADLLQALGAMAQYMTPARAIAGPGEISFVPRWESPALSSMWQPPAAAEKLGIPVYHGTSTEFPEFDLAKMGSGEGGQTYGWGMYFAEHPDTARYYMQRFKDKGKMLKAQLHVEDEHLFQFDKPLAEQTPYVKDKLRKAGLINEEDAPIGIRNSWDIGPGLVPKEGPAPHEWKGRRLMFNLQYSPQVQTYLNKKLGIKNEWQALPPTPRHLSQFLESIDIPGLKYADALSRKPGTAPTYNYVIWHNPKMGIPTPIDPAEVLKR